MPGTDRVGAGFNAAVRPVSEPAVAMVLRKAQHQPALKSSGADSLSPASEQSEVSVLGIGALTHDVQVEETGQPNQPDLLSARQPQARV